jgi:NAD(P) transhydrogenase
MAYDFDLLVIGSGPAGQKAAIQAAKLHRRVAIVEQQRTVGGVCINSGTIPSKTLREAVLFLTGMTQRSMYGDSYRVKDDVTISDLFFRTQSVIQRESDVVHDQLSRNHVRILNGTGSFSDDHTGLVDEGNEKIPDALLVVGAGVIGIEYASMFAALGSRVTVVEARPQLLDFCDAEIVEALRYHLRDLNVVFRLDEEVVGVDEHESETITHLKSGKRILADTVLYSAGRQGATDALELGNVGIEADARGRISVDEHYRTSVEHIYAVGDVIGFPSLAATSMEQCRLASAHACGIDVKPISDSLPIGIYTIPEISFVGSTEEQLTREQTPYEVGISRYRELARGAILGDAYGMLKLLVSSDDRRLLGVHAFGTTATELVHIGQTVMGFGGTVDYLVEAVFNYPTLAEGYKVAALDATNKLRAISTLSASAPT